MSDIIPTLMVPVTQKVVTASSGNLFEVAAQELGDATQWTRIAKLNGMTDPFFVGLVVLRIPPVSAKSGTGGVLYA